MIYSKNNLLLLVITTLLVSFSSCYTKIDLTGGSAILKEINFRDGSTVNLNISDLISFNTKSNSSVVEASLSDVKSINAFLTTNPTDPFLSGSNPLGNGVMISRNYVGNSIISFTNVPIGGPYYAVVAAFDDVTSSSTKNNITNPNLTLTSIDNKWSISGNSVNVLPSRNLAFSNTSTTLDVDLILRRPLPNSISTAIIVNDGTTAPVQTPININ